MDALCGADPWGGVDIHGCKNQRSLDGGVVFVVVRIGVCDAVVVGFFGCGYVAAVSTAIYAMATSDRARYRRFACWSRDLRHV